MRQHGGKRQGAGRKPRALELKAAENLRAVLEDDFVITKLAEKVEAGDMRAIELWLGYIYGKPNQNISGDLDVTIVKPPIDWINE
jgi:hypothetical protein